LPTLDGFNYFDSPGPSPASSPAQSIHSALGPEGVEKKENKQQPGKNRYGEDTQHVEKFIWHLKMIIGYKLIATMLTLSSPLADLRMELELGRGGGAVNGLNLYRQSATVNK